jgi:hypothetical protein
MAEAERTSADVRRYQELYSKDEISRQQLMGDCHRAYSLCAGRGNASKSRSV